MGGGVIAAANVIVETSECPGFVHLSVDIGLLTKVKVFVDTLGPGCIMRSVYTYYGWRILYSEWRLTLTPWEKSNQSCAPTFG